MPLAYPLKKPGGGRLYILLVIVYYIAMKIEVNITKRYFFALLPIVLVLAAVFVVNAYGTNNPPVFGHTPGEIDPGTFGGGSSGSFVFPGRVCLGGDCRSAWPGAVSGFSTIQCYTSFIEHSVN